MRIVNPYHCRSFQHLLVEEACPIGQEMSLLLQFHGIYSVVLFQMMFIMILIVQSRRNANMVNFKHIVT